MGQPLSDLPPQPGALARTHKTARTRLRKRLEDEGYPPAEVAAAVEALRARQGREPVPQGVGPSRARCPFTATGRHLWNSSKGKARCRRCGYVGLTKREYKRRRLRERDGNWCQICGGAFTRRNPATLDHVKPRADGGKDGLDNLRLAHRSCNELRGREPVRCPSA